MTADTAARRAGTELDQPLTLDEGLSDYWSMRWRRNNARRLEFLAALRLPIAGRRVLELGAGIGDHTEFLIDRQCQVTALEGRAASVQVLRRRFAAHPDVTAREVDLDPPPDEPVDEHDVVLCLGLLYHLSHPRALLDWAARRTAGLLILESIVDPSAGAPEPVFRAEDPASPGASIHGTASRVTREWIRSTLSGHFPHVYTTVGQVPHYEFPIDWAAPAVHATRALFIASRTPIDDPWLTTTLPDRHPWP